MDKEELIRNLKYTMEKHKNDFVPTFGTNIFLMCQDILDYLEGEPCEDAVSRTEVKKIAKEMYLEVANMKLDVTTISDCISYTSSKCREVLERKLQTLPSVTPTQRWIPCSERLPKKSGFYLVSTNDCITIMEFYKGWISQNLGSCNWYVKAWMQLPDAYKKEVK